MAVFGWRCTLENENNRCLAVVDNTDPDNLACVLALANMQDKSKLLGVVVTGRAANFNRDAAIEDIDTLNSMFATNLNTVRMKNFLRISGRDDIPVFAGCWPPNTIVPHSMHIDELEFDDLTDGQLDKLRGNELFKNLGISYFNEAELLVESQNHPVDLIVGGPMTDVMYMTNDLTIPSSGRKNANIRSVHAQFGMFGFGERGLMEFGDKPRGNRQFNVACDPAAAHDVLMNLEAPVFLYPSDVTHVEGIGFSDPDELESFLEDTPATRELVRIYRIAYERMIKPRGEKIYIHDVAPVLGYLQYLGESDAFSGRGVFYQTKLAEITHVPYENSEYDRWGEIDMYVADDGELDPCTRDMVAGPPRFVARRVYEANYMEALRKLLK